MDEKKKSSGEIPSGVSRRTFLGAAGLAASAAFLGPLSRLSGDSTYYYLNSFGEVVPVSPDLIDIGVYPPPLPADAPIPNQAAEHRGGGRNPSPDALGSRANRLMDFGLGPNTTTVSPGYPKFNILMIMVDQLRSPRWVPYGGSVGTLESLTPNITSLKNQSFSFPNFFVAATACTPSRSTLLTGLYTQQTCLYQTQAGETCQPDLQTAFPNIASVLGQNTAVIGIDYESYWVGKWHLSDPYTGSGGQGASGPTAYNFSTVPPYGNLNFPPGSTIASPNGGGNAGSEGYNPSGYSPTHDPLPPNTHIFGEHLYNDAAICDFFLGTTAPELATFPTNSHWFAAVSFVNPHDITQFPFSYNLSNKTHFGTTPINAPKASYPPPNATLGSPGIGSGTEFADTYLPPLNAIYATTGSPTPSKNWNYQDGPTPYNSGVGKPDVQTNYQTYIDNLYGQCDGSVISWNTFLNYYFWMQSCVDVQIGRIMQKAPAAVLNNAVIVFLSDHGDYGGSHNLHAKGGALYDEAINVPLYISYPSMRGNVTSTIPIPYVCSMVDILPYLYTLGLGNESWRGDTTGVINYLSNRESISDAIYMYSHPTTLALQRRVSTIPNQNGPAPNNQTYQPYILTATDEFPSALVNGVSVPPHALGFRTVDLTQEYVNADGANVYGGGKLGIYSFWPAVPMSPTLSNINQTLTQPTVGSAQQFEFYDYSVSKNYPELGNEWNTNPRNSMYLTAFNNIAVQNELYPPGAFTLGKYNVAYQDALLAYALAAANSVCVAAGMMPLDNDENLDN